MKRFYKPYMFTILWLIFILVLICIPGNLINEVDLSFLNWLSPDKIVHVFMFGFLSFFILIEIKWTAKTFHFKSAFFVSMGVSIFFSGMTELLQFAVISGRDGNVFDFLADVLGGFLGVIVFYLFFLKKR